MAYLSYLVSLGKSYSVINTHKSMLLQTLQLLGQNWCYKPLLITRFMRGIFIMNPPQAKYAFTWDVGQVLRYLSKLFPLQDLDVKLLSFKTVALLALSTAARAQTLIAMNIHNMCISNKDIQFYFSTLLKTSRQRKRFYLKIPHFPEERICPMHTLLHYLDRTLGLRKCDQLIVSFRTFKAITSSTLARWLKAVLQLSGIDVQCFKAHSYRSASASAAYRGGCSLQEILRTADWSSAKNFRKFYLRDVNSNKTFVKAVLAMK